MIIQRNEVVSFVRTKGADPGFLEGEGPLGGGSGESFEKLKVISCVSLASTVNLEMPR